jgi:hypothetical protein
MLPGTLQCTSAISTHRGSSPEPTVTDKLRTEKFVEKFVETFLEEEEAEEEEEEEEVVVVVETFVALLLPSYG